MNVAGNSSKTLLKEGRAHLSLATGHRYVHEPPGVCDSLLSSAFGRLLLLLRFDLLQIENISICHAQSCDGWQDAGMRTFGVWDLTLPARAREPWTLPMIAVWIQWYLEFVDVLRRGIWTALLGLMRAV